MYEITYEKDNQVITQICSFRWTEQLRADQSVTILSIKYVM